MHSVAAILDFAVLYRYSLILALACCAGICFFMACCCHAQIPVSRAAAAVLTAILLSLPLSRLVYWYGRPDSFPSLLQALTAPVTEAYALTGVLAGCAVSAVLWADTGGRLNMLDCMSVAGCGAIALGRLGSFFTETSRGQIMTHFTGLPWAYPVANASGQPEYRFATFLFQAAAAALLGIFLAAVFRRKKRSGDVTLLFLLLYGASQVILDSTRYDSLYLRSNGFISIVQILSALAMVFAIVTLCIRTVHFLGFRRWMPPLWLCLTGFFGGAGYMEYYVQRHGREALFSYCLMGFFLICICIAGLVMWYRTRQPNA